jgi:hypothetical protein
MGHLRTLLARLCVAAGAGMLALLAVAPQPAGAVSVVGYSNPLRSVQGLVPERIDQGVDYAGTGPVYPIGRAVVTYVNTSGQWFPPAPYYIAYRLKSGTARGHTVYVAECIVPSVHVGETVFRSTAIGTMTNCGWGIETGWADAQLLPNTAAAACWNNQYNNGGNDPSGYGVNFSDLLGRLGAPRGIAYGPTICPVPSSAGLRRY